MARSLPPSGPPTSNHTGTVESVPDAGYRYATTLRSETGVGDPAGATAINRELRADPEGGPW